MGVLRRRRTRTSCDLRPASADSTPVHVRRLREREESRREPNYLRAVSERLIATASVSTANASRATPAPSARALSMLQLQPCFEDGLPVSQRCEVIVRGD